VTFVDTSVLLCAASTDPREARKAASARAVLDRPDLAVSAQVLQELYVEATGATRRDRLTHEQAASLVEAWLRFIVQDVTLPLMLAALQAAARYRLSCWDAAIIEAARLAGCS
jgi:predicted nucleic acid-binding protein